jgi:hypothetical protein
MYKNKDAIATAGNTSPTSGTKILGKSDAFIFLRPCALTHVQYMFSIAVDAEDTKRFSSFSGFHD